MTTETTKGTKHSFSNERKLNEELVRLFIFFTFKMNQNQTGLFHFSFFIWQKGGKTYQKNECERSL